MHHPHHIPEEPSKDQEPARENRATGGNPMQLRRKSPRSARQASLQSKIDSSPRMQQAAQFQNRVNSASGAQGSVMQRFNFKTRLGTRVRGETIDIDIDNAEELDEYFQKIKGNGTYEALKVALHDQVKASGDRDIILAWNALMDQWEGGVAKLRVPAAVDSPPTAELTTAVGSMGKGADYKNMAAFLTSVAGGNKVGGIDQSNFWGKVWSHAGNKDWVKTKGRAQGGDHEWLPTGMISDIVTKKTRADEWIDHYFKIRSRTLDVIFNREYTASDGSGKKVMSGHTGAIYYYNAGKKIASTQGQKEFHDDLRKIVINEHDPDKVKPEIALVVKKWLWDGSDIYSGDAAMHPNMYHGAATGPIFPRGLVFASMRAQQKIVYDTLLATLK